MKKIIALLLVLAMALTLVACGGGSEKPAETQAPAAENTPAEPEAITLKVWAPQVDQVDENSWLNVMLPKFEAAHPEYKITWDIAVCGEGDAAGIVKNDPAAAADVYFYANDQMGTLIEAGALAKLGGSYLENVKANFPQTHVDLLTYTDGGVYGFPTAPNTWFMWYNKSIFSEEDVKNLNTMLEKGTVVDVIGEVGLALGLLVVFFAVMQAVFLHLPRMRLYRIGVGILYTFLGLVMFLAAVTVGFMPIGYRIGHDLAGRSGWLVGIGFVLGLVVVLAEPAIHVLKKQVEDVTNGTVSRRAMMLALSIGVGVSIGLSMVRIIFGFSILYYLIPGYFISLGLSFFVPRIYTAIAFDSGGVASGPLTSSFILPLAVGACVALQGTTAVMTHAFGIVAMVAMTPLITIQVMGFRAVMAGKVRDNIMMKQILGADDAQIIDFM